LNKEDKKLKPALHGGDIVSASEQYGIAQEQWIDLSTGLNPDSYPIDDVPASTYCHLPYLQPDFLTASSQYYGSDQGMGLIGSQMIIQALPKCVEKYPVLLPSAGYTEHRAHWQKHQFEVVLYDGFDKTQASAQIQAALEENAQQHLVIINPNNPTGMMLDVESIMQWAKMLGEGCYIVVDEAFIDTQPNQSLLKQIWPQNVLVLRSFGKFFGLAGIRIGFAFCTGELRSKIEQVLGLWMINGPAQYIATKAMMDSDWQDNAREQIESAALKTQQLFAPLVQFINEQDSAATEYWQTHQALFSSYKMAIEQALNIQEFFAQQGILVRVIELPDEVENKRDKNPAALLRVGIVGLHDSVNQQRIKDCVEAYIADSDNDSRCKL
jgi:cobalamin biosynthetic protein CobC